MGVYIPEDIKVLSTEFKDFVVELANEVNRVSESYMDLQRVRALVAGSVGSADVGAFAFFIVESGGTTIKSVSGDGITMTYREYTGTVVEFDGIAPSRLGDSVVGYDFSTQSNEPDTSPTQANILGPDPLDEGTVVCCSFIGEVAAFTSVMPRLSVECG